MRALTLVPATEIVLVDVSAVAELLDAEECRRPRLSPSDKVRFASMRSGEERARDWRAGRIATRIVLERWVGSAFRCVDFVTETGGRLRLPSTPPFFSVSHSGDALLIAVSAGGVVGVDLEQVRTLSMPDERRDRLRRASALIDGVELFDARMDELSDRAVLESWVRLEAVAKARGSGIGVLLTEAGVVGRSEERLAAKTIPFEARLLDVGSGLVAAVASAALPIAMPVVRFPEDAAAIATFLAVMPGS